MDASENPTPEPAEQPEQPEPVEATETATETAAESEAGPEAGAEASAEDGSGTGTATGPEPLNLDQLADQAERPDEAARDQMRTRLAALAVPAAGLGRLEELAIWLAGARGSGEARPIERARVVVFAGDHGVAALGVSATAPDQAQAVTAARVKQIEDGGGAVGVLARLHGATVRVVDVSVGSPSGRVDKEDAATREQIEHAFRLGMAVADAEADSGADVLIPALVGVGASTVASVLAGVLTGKDAAAVTGRGSGVDDTAWMRKCAAVRDAMRRGRPVLGDQLELLAKIGGRDFAALTGFLLQAVIRRVPVLLDGVTTTSCAMLVQRIAYRSPQWLLAGALSPEPAHRSALDRLSLEPLVEGYDVRQSEGALGLLALPMLKAAAALATELATFDEAGIPEPVLRSRV
ncbi:nicotinate-nucleotide--dimethylbenzimidazole phosphoribosyltransferase [Catenulispora sp. NF23]|uniref:nicotinate-nucleotide--dimethylbenzimidazole phosphoribosyltransferase n=1 Tax=Catenulispora pinistramenti TaxID=2705254 RepID=UPI001BA728D8|nr:nicotinate-nucleotide--dimethylbenzimidazole phosphoribosyltransferase [Catenulispora pinistramenti]MBS2539447.1 nicotinate-nucleotide--dimethylbenzimidazole phosphoribosyltransferase [Catenulispora pinistramenti]